MTPPPDRLHRFLIENTNVRGELVHLDNTWRTLLTNGDYPSEVRLVLGQAVSAVALLAATVKFDGSLSLQISGDGPLHSLVVQATSQSRCVVLPAGTAKPTARSFPICLAPRVSC